MEVKGARYDKITNLLFFANSLLIAKLINDISPGTFNKTDIISYILTDKVVAMIILPLVCYLSLFLIPANWKEYLVFMGRRHMPGCFAFSKLAKNDFRISDLQIYEKYPSIPPEGTEQNKYWYTVYRRVANDEMVKKSHDDRLIARDMTVISFLFLIVSLFTYIYLTSRIDNKAIYILLFFIEYLLTNISTRVLSRRFVLNAIVADIAR